MPIWSIMEEQKKQKFQENGFCIVENAVPEALLTKLSKMANELEAAALQQSGSLENEQVALDSIEAPTTVYRINHLYRTHSALMNELLSTPAVHNSVLAIAGQDVIPLSIDINFKSSHPVAKVPWHQDSIHSGNSPYFVMGVYLDDANENDGCLRCLPGSHKQKLDVHDLASVFGWAIPNHVQIPVSSGDLLFHDVMTLHGSSSKISPGQRRTIYVEFRSATDIVATKAQSESWVNMRKRWMTEIKCKVFSNSDSKRNADLNHEALPETFYENLFLSREPPTPSNWAFPPVKRHDYP